MIETYTISDIEISNSRFGYEQEVKLILNNVKEIYILVEEIFHNTGIYPDELEVLIGSKVLVTSDEINSSITKYCLTVSDLMEFRKEGKSSMEMINEVNIIEEFKGKRVVLSTSQREYNINMSVLTIQTCLSSTEFSALEGCFINPEFFNIGEKMGKYVCKKEDTTIKDLNLRFQIGFREKVQQVRDHNPEQADDRIIAGNLNIRNGYENEHHESYDKYGGPRDGYGGSLSDNFIDDALGGEPDAYWNID